MVVIFLVIENNKSWSWSEGWGRREEKVEILFSALMMLILNSKFIYDPLFLSLLYIELDPIFDTQS